MTNNSDTSQPQPIKGTAPLVQPKVCKRCDAHLRPDAKFCNVCGVNLETGEDLTPHVMVNAAPKLVGSQKDVPPPTPENSPVVVRGFSARAWILIGVLVLIIVMLVIALVLVK